MKYVDLYNFCQNLPPEISRASIRAEIKQKMGISFLMARVHALEPEFCRGFYVNARNSQHPLVASRGNHVVATAHKDKLGKGAYCWERFITVKEMVHIFDDVSEATDSGDVFDRLLTEFALPNNQLSPQMHAEVACFWRALGLLCPENYRQQIAIERQARRIDDYGIAYKLKIPEQYVPRLFDSRYERAILQETEIQLSPLRVPQVQN